MEMELIATRGVFSIVTKSTNYGLCSNIPTGWGEIAQEFKDVARKYPADPQLSPEGVLNVCYFGGAMSVGNCTVSADEKRRDSRFCPCTIDGTFDFQQFFSIVHLP